MTALILTRDVNGLNTYGLPFCSDGACITLSSGGGEKTVTAPTSNASGYLAVFKVQDGKSVWISLESITLPTSSFASTKADLNPASRNVAAGATLYFKTSETSADVKVSFYELPSF